MQVLLREDKYGGGEERTTMIQIISAFIEASSRSWCVAYRRGLGCQQLLELLLLLEEPLLVRQAEPRRTDNAGNGVASWTHFFLTKHMSLKLPVCLTRSY